MQQIVKSLALTMRIMSIFSCREKLEMMERIYRRLQQNQDSGDSIHDDCCGKSNPNKRRDRIYAPHCVEELNNCKFKRMFRMNKTSFEKLLLILDPYLVESNEDMANRSSGSAVSKRTKLYCTLRWLAGGSHHDIGLLFGVGDSTFFTHDDSKAGIIWPVINAINAAFDIGLPKETEKLEQIAIGFSKYTNGEMMGCVSAIDGVVIEIRQLSKRDVDDVMAYRTRKGMWGVVVLAGCDSNCRFNMFSAKYSGTTNDALA